MKINIRERYQKVSQYLKETSNHICRAIAEALNISKSIVQRHIGIKGGIGSDSLAKFFQVLRLNEHIGVSVSALREIEVQFKAKIIEYEQA